MLVLAVVAVKLLVLSPQPLQNLLFLLAQLLRLVDLPQGPVQQQSGLFESVGYLRSPQHYSHVRFIFEGVGSGEAGPCGHSDSGLESEEALPSEKLVGIFPLHPPAGAYEPVLHCRYLVYFGGDHFPKQFVLLHAGQAELADVSGGGLGLQVGQSVRIGEFAVLHPQLLGAPVHLLHEQLLQHFVIHFFVTGLPVPEEVLLCRPRGQFYGCVIAAGEHQPVQQILYRVLFSFIQFGGSACHIGHFLAHRYPLGKHILSLRLVYLAQNDEKGHYLCQRGYLHRVL